MLYEAFLDNQRLKEQKLRFFSEQPSSNFLSNSRNVSSRSLTVSMLPLPLVLFVCLFTLDYVLLDTNKQASK